MKATPRRTRSPEASRGDILAAATESFAERGYHTATVDDIAARAGLSKGAVYWHFKNKRELFFALFEELTAASTTGLAAMGGAPDATTALRGWVLASVEALPSGPAYVDLSLEFLAQSRVDAELRERVRAVYRESRDAISAQIERGKRGGEFGDVVSAEMGSAFIALLDGLLMAEIVRPDVDLEHTVIQAVDLWLEGMRP